MAERPTKRERKDEAKKRRQDELRRRARSARMRKLYTYGTVLAVILAIVLYLVLNSIARNNKIKEAGRVAKAAGCEPVQKNLKDEGHEHIQPPTTVNYLTQPPTSGNHYNVPGQAPTFTGIHDTPIQDEAQVHNLEHGHILIQYKPNEIPPTLLNELDKLVREHPTFIILAPRTDKMPFKVAFTAWRTLQGCNNPNDKAAEAARLFYDLYHDHGPESIPGTPVLPSPSASGASPSASASASAKPSPTGTSTKKLSDFFPTQSGSASAKASASASASP